jgi:hypothetical protein
MNLLVVDFDSFFPVVEREAQERFPGEAHLYDWGHAESPFFITGVWTIRAEPFVRHDVPLPRTSGQEAGFWDRFTISPDATCYYADSNCRALRSQVRAGVSQVWLYDAHHDSGYQNDLDQAIMRDAWTCENWMAALYLMGAELHMRYPQWRHYALADEPEPYVPVDRAVDDGSSPPVTFDRVFVCRSGAWVPPWLDEDFLEFVANCPAMEEPIAEGAEPRPFDLDQVKNMAAWLTREMARQGI